MLKQSKASTSTWTALSLDDEKTYELFSAGLTSGVFQFESSGMKDILRRFKPSSIEHLTALNALYRPGPIGGGMIDDFIKRKHGAKKVEYEFPELKPVLAETYGVIVYQEQVMQIANIIAGYSLGEADLLRRAMGKKKAEEMAAHRQSFVRGAKEKGFKDEKKITRLFDLMEQFAGYGFNKSHSAAYAVLAYRTAYLKAHYPQYFMAAILTSERGNQEKIVKYINECREMGIAILAAGRQRQRRILHAVVERYSFRAGRDQERRRIGHFVDRCGEALQESALISASASISRTVNKRVIESLIKAGAFDSVDMNRSLLYGNIDRAMDWGQRKQREREIGQGGLFGMLAQGNDEHEMDPAEAWPEGLKLKHEKETLGFYITGHPLRKYAVRGEDLRECHDRTLCRKSRRVSMFRLAESFPSLRVTRTKKGDPMGVVLLEDWEGIVEVLVFPDTFAKTQRLLDADAPIIVRGKLDNDESVIKILASEIYPIERVAEVLSRTVTIRVGCTNRTFGPRRTAPAADRRKKRLGRDYL